VSTPAPGPSPTTDPADFFAHDLRVGTIVEAVVNERARVPAYVLRIDFGPAIGERTSSAQVTDRYRPEDLVGRQVVAVVSFPPRRVAGVRSEVLVTGAVPDTGGVVLLRPDEPVADGTRVG